MLSFLDLLRFLCIIDVCRSAFFTNFCEFFCEVLYLYIVLKNGYAHDNHPIIIARVESTSGKWSGMFSERQRHKRSKFNNRI